jgi:type IV secretory pathway TraG/TraD family ATPase VirD4
MTVIPSALVHGSTGFVAAMGLSAVGLATGLRKARVPVGRLFLFTLVYGVPVTVVAAMFWAFVCWMAAPVVTHLPQDVTALCGIVFIVFFGFGAAVIAARPRSDHIRRRGTLLQSTFWLAGRPKSKEGITFAGEPISLLDEMKHFKLIGTTGTGKSTAIRGLLEGALARGDRAVIADPDGSYLERFYDPARGDVILNPFHERAARWDVFAEVLLPHDADQLARSLIPDYDGSDRSWRQYARTFLTAILRQLHEREETDLAKLYYLMVVAPPGELRGMLSLTPAGPFLSEGNEEYFGSVRSVANVHLAALEHVASQSAGEPLSVRRWIREGRGVLFLPYKAGEIAVLRYLISTWMRLAIFEAMNGPAIDQRLWFVMDELDALGAIDGLKDALARLRKFGGRCALGFQSIAQMRGTNGDAEAQTIVENCGNTLILRCSASEKGGTAEFASRLIGQREVIRKQTSESQSTILELLSRRGINRTVTHQHAVEDAVLPSEIEQLPDLSGFVKVASRPEWRRVSLRST